MGFIMIYLQRHVEQEGGNLLPSTTVPSAGKFTIFRVDTGTAEVWLYLMKMLKVMAVWMWNELGKANARVCKIRTGSD